MSAKNVCLEVLTDFTVCSLPSLVTFTVVTSDGVHTSSAIHTHVHVAFIDVCKKMHSATISKS